MTRIVNDTLYSDLGLGFIAHPVTGRLVAVKNNKSISQSIKNCVLTNFNERYKLPYFGSNVKASLFENFDPVTLMVLRRDIVDCIRNNEPRVDQLEVTVGDELDNNKITVSIVYTTKNSLEPETVTFFLERVR